MVTSFMAKYKILSRYKQPIWFEKRAKIKNFKRRKWELIKKAYFPRKFKFFNQDVASYALGDTYDSDRSIRLKKTYKFLLQDKQRFQLYYGAGRLKFFRLKTIAQTALRLSQIKALSPGKALLHLFERRLDTSLYRLGLVSSLMQARRLINSAAIKVFSLPHSILGSPGFALRAQDFISLDPAWFPNLLGRYLKVNTPFFYFRNKKIRKEIIFDRQDSFQKSFLLKNDIVLLKLLRTQLVALQKVRKNKV